MPAHSPHVGFLKNENKKLNIKQAPQPIFTADLIILRLAFARAGMQSQKGLIRNIRKLIYQQDVSEDMVKLCAKNVMEVQLRLYKLKVGMEVLSQSLGQYEQIFELNHKTVEFIEQLARLNSASILLMKTMTRAVDPDKMVFLGQLCKLSY